MLLRRQLREQQQQVARVMAEWIACDRCGYSKVDGQPIARAWFRVYLKSGRLYLCRHHYQKHRNHLAVCAYSVQEMT